MSNVSPFIPSSTLSAKRALNEYIYWAKSQIYLYDLPIDPMLWDALSWHHWGLKTTICTKLGSKSIAFDPDFINFAKAMLFDERAAKNKEGNIFLFSLRCLEAALLDCAQKADVTAATAAVFDRACVIANKHYSSHNTIYAISLGLKGISDYLNAMGFVATPFQWEPQIRGKRKTLESSAKSSVEKMPSDKALISLGEIFNTKPELPLDIMITSAVAIMLSHPSRVGELKYVEKDCLFTEKDVEGRDQLYMLWHSAKGFGANKKIIPDSMREICQEAVSRLFEVTQNPREYAKWLEENPDLFPSHRYVPEKKLDESLSVKEACDALMIFPGPESSKGTTPRRALKKFLTRTVESREVPQLVRNAAQEILDGYDESYGVRVFVNGKLDRVDFNDEFCITLRKLNMLVRGKYLNEFFPYTDEKKVTKWKDALFCFYTGAFNPEKHGHKPKPFGLIGPVGSRITAQLSGSSKGVSSIFERYGYDGVRVNTHAFRHYLNTGAHRSNLSQDLIARWSGRVDISQNKVYNHMSEEEKADEIKFFTPQLASNGNDLLSSLKVNAPISMKDLGEDSDRIVHFTEFGVCVHDYAQEPCAKFNNCLTCSEHVCVKGDDKKLENLKDEKKYLLSSLESFQKESSEGTYGANTWLETTLEKIKRCDQLIDILENPDVESGAIIKGVENNWTASSNALAMNGEPVENKSRLISTDKEDEQVAELERLLGINS